MNYKLPELPYAYDALEPHLDARTMEIHHSKHHAAYVNNLNAALEKHPEIAEKPLEELLGNLNRVPEDIRAAVRNHGGGHLNHALFWRVMAPSGKGGGGEPSGQIAEEITKRFGTVAAFKEQFTKAAISIFGSGWAWLAVKDGTLEILATPNQDSPVTQGASPILGLDVWEHAYYLKYENRRPEYVEAWWKVVAYEEVARRFEETLRDKGRRSG